MKFGGPVTGASQLLADRAAVAAAAASINDDTTILTVTGTQNIAGIQAAAAAAQLVTDKAAVDAEKANIVTGTTILTKAGSYPTTATSQAAQLATDQAAVDAGKADILTSRTILGVTGLLVPVVDIDDRGLPVTGQTTSYRTGDDGYFQCGRKPGTTPLLVQLFGTKSAGTRWTNNGDGTYTDNLTGLMWLNSPAGPKTWDQAIDEPLAYTNAGYTDWRCPNANEWASVMDWGARDFVTPLISSSGWTSTTHANPTTYTWYPVSSWTGYAAFTYKEKADYGTIMAVRGGVYNAHTP
jgi:hypothetical protein